MKTSTASLFGRVHTLANVAGRAAATVRAGRIGIGLMSVLLAAAEGTCIIEIDDGELPPGGCIEIAVDCGEGREPVDLDGDGCALECEDTGVRCPAVAVECEDGAAPVDLDGDGCPLECPQRGGNCPDVYIECEDGAPTVDLDGDGCALECEDTGVPCPAIAVECEDDAEPVDLDGDGCPLECPAEQPAPDDACAQCLADGGTWQPSADACTDNCAIQDISCYRDACPAPCSASSCGSCFAQDACSQAGCQWVTEAEASFCN